MGDNDCLKGHAAVEPHCPMSLSAQSTIHMPTHRLPATVSGGKSDAVNTDSNATSVAPSARNDRTRVSSIMQMCKLSLRACSSSTSTQLAPDVVLVLKRASRSSGAAPDCRRALQYSSTLVGSAFSDRISECNGVQLPRVCFSLAFPATGRPSRLAVSSS